MSRNNITRVPPPTKFFGTVDVTVEPSDDVLNFQLVNDAISYLEALPESENPIAGILWGIRLHSGLLFERFDLPVNTSIVGVSPVGQAVLGGSDVQTGDAIISVRNGSVASLILQAIGVTGNPETMFWVKNSLSVYTKRDSVWTLPLTGTELKITPQGFSQETFIFTASEVDAATVAAFIVANGVNLTAVAKHNTVEITGTINQSLTVDKTGTANDRLGFSTITNETTVSNNVEILVAKELAIVGNTSIDKAVLFSDNGSGQYALINTKTAGTQNGIYFEDGAEGIIRSSFPSLHSNAGVYIESNAIAQFEGGNSKINIGQDVINHGTLIANSFSYKKIINTGILIPSGSRITFEWNMTGVLVPGTFIDGSRPVPYDMTIESVQFARRINGTDSDTIIDINTGNSGGGESTIYTTQANRPSVNFVEGNEIVKLATLPDIMNISKGDYMSIDIDQVEGGGGPNAPSDIYVVVTAVVN